MVTHKTTLGLNLPTDPRWVDIATMNIGKVLNDHAWCEQKAASSCISLIIQFPDKEKLVETLAPVAAEEWNHFRKVLYEMKKRQIPLLKGAPDEYVIALSRLERKGDKIERQLIDRLLINALIEARSAEKFKLLSQHLNDEGLRGFYYELMVSESGHYRNFISLAKEYTTEQIVLQRWNELLIAEAGIINDLGITAGKFH